MIKTVINNLIAVFFKLETININKTAKYTFTMQYDRMHNIISKKQHMEQSNDFAYLQLCVKIYGFRSRLIRYTLNSTNKERLFIPFLPR